MQLADYRELYELLIDGAIRRATKGDEQALGLPGKLMMALRTALPPEDRAMVTEVIEGDWIERQAKRAPEAVAC